MLLEEKLLVFFILIVASWEMQSFKVNSLKKDV